MQYGRFSDGSAGLVIYRQIADSGQRKPEFTEVFRIMEFYIDDGVLWDFRDEDYNTRIIIPHGVRVIGEAAFANNEHIYHVVIPDSAERIERDAFLRCYSLSGVEIPDSVTYIGPYAFADCRELKSVFIPESVTEIDLFSFWIYKDWDEYLTGGPYCIYGKRGSEAERFAQKHPFLFKEVI